MKTIESEMRKQLAKGLLQQRIYCPVNGAVLDQRTCRVIVGNDGDPYMVISPEAAEKLVAIATLWSKPNDGLSPGLTLLPGAGIDQFEEAEHDADNAG